MIRKIDVHAHVKPQSDPTGSRRLNASELFTFYDPLSIEKGVILPLASDMADSEVLSPENARKIASEMPERFYWFTSVSLSRPWQKEEMLSYLKGEKEKGAKGVGEVTSRVYFDSPEVELLFTCCEEVELPVLFHLSTGFDKGYGVVDEPGLVQMERMLKKHPKVKFIGHAKPFWSEISQPLPGEDRSKCSKSKVNEGRLARLMREIPNLYCDLSAQSGANAMMRDEAYACRFMEEFQDRVLYGCDTTLLTNTHPKVFCQFFDSLYLEKKISSAAYEKIARYNAIQLLGLKDH